MLADVIISDFSYFYIFVNQWITNIRSAIDENREDVK